jgi:hypothetical protein
VRRGTSRRARRALFAEHAFATSDVLQVRRTLAPVSHRRVTESSQGTPALANRRTGVPGHWEDVICHRGALELRDLMLSGHSMRGDVIAEASLTLGDRVAGIVWVDTYSRLTTPDTPEHVDAQSSRSVNI